MTRPTASSSRRGTASRAGLAAGGAALAALALAAGLGAPPPAAADPAPPAFRRLAERLARHGRVEVAVTRTVADRMSGRTLTARGTLAAEPPDRLALVFPASGERITLRGDGGEWLQPRLRQMLTLGAERAEGARRWWAVLLGAEDPGVRIVAETARRLRLEAVDGAGEEAGSAVVHLDAGGLPARLEVDEGGGAPTLYRFTGWRFTRPQGRSAFVLRAPAGYEVVPLP